MKPPSIAAGLLVQVSGLEPPVSVSKLQVKHLKPENKMGFFIKLLLFLRGQTETLFIVQLKWVLSSA